MHKKFTIVQNVLYLYCIMWQTHCCYYQQEMTKYCPTLLPILFYCHGTVGKGETKAVGSSERMDNLCKTACRLTIYVFLKTVCSRKTFQKAPMVYFFFTKEKKYFIYFIIFILFIERRVSKERIAFLQLK